MNNHFCTFFDKNYLGRGLALYYSLLDHCKDFTLWILCTDDICYEMLEKLNLPKIKLYRMAEVEDEKMLAVKGQRTAIEYSWMFGSQFPLFLFKNIGMKRVIYVDADITFFNDMNAIDQEMEDRSIMIIPHRYSPKNLFREKTSGIYNVGMLIFKNDNNAIQCLTWWKERCIEWCFARYEDGKHGDQMYLNDWPERFNNVCVLQYLGAGVAPWNIDNYRFFEEKNNIFGIEKTTAKKFNLLFYHYHGLKIYDNNGEIKAYPITTYNRYIYSRTMLYINTAYRKIRELEKDWTFGCTGKLDLFRRIKQNMTIFFTRR